MQIPFTVEQFFGVFARYNEAVWPMQIVLSVLAVAVAALLFRPRDYSGRLIAAALAFFWAWMAVVYHFAFFTAINPAAWGFGAFSLAGALWLAWIGVLQGRLRFSLSGGLRARVGGLLVLFALLVYPLLGFLAGHRYPAVPTFGLPCPTTIFTIGVLLLAAPPVPRSLFVVPVLWSAVGSVAAVQLRVPQDYGLLVAGIAGLADALFPGQPAGRMPHR